MSASNSNIYYLSERATVAEEAKSKTDKDRDNDDAESSVDQDRSARDERRETRRDRDRYEWEGEDRRRDYRDRVRREGRHAEVASRDAVRSFIRSQNDAWTLMTPPGFLRPGEFLRTVWSTWGMFAEMQRAAMDEFVQAGRDNLRRAAREAERDERVDYDDEYGYYEEDRDAERDVRRARREQERYERDLRDDSMIESRERRSA